MKDNETPEATTLSSFDAALRDEARPARSLAGAMTDAGLRGFRCEVSFHEQRLVGGTQTYVVSAVDVWREAWVPAGFERKETT